MTAPYFGYCWVGNWDIRGAKAVKDLRGILPNADLHKLPDLSAAAPQFVQVLRTSMLSESSADTLRGIEWSLHADTNQHAGDSFIAIRAIDADQATAKAWIDTPDGRIWRTGATSFALISVKAS